MHFDDRLATVLRARGDSLAVARIQYRQLLDLLGTLPIENGGSHIEAAYVRLSDLARQLDASERAGMVREPGLRLRNPRLVAMLAAAEPVVAAAAIASAQLGDEEWLDLAPALPAGALGMVRQRRDLGPRAEALFDRIGMIRPGLGAPIAETNIAEVTIAPAPAALEPEAPGRTSGIGAIVQRIEDFRKARAPLETSSSGEAPHLPFAEALPQRVAPLLQAFDFATDAAGRIVWSDPGMAPMAVGLRLASRETAGPASSIAALAVALRQRQPVRRLLLEIDGAPSLAGRWSVDASPCFDPLSGSYTGHAGRMRRPRAVPGAHAVTAAPDSEADRMRQLLHELRTPVNAIQGFAEVIQQQLFGAVPHEYRALAASIAGDAAQMLAGFEELERLARLESGKLAFAGDGSDLAGIIVATAQQLHPFTQPRGSGFELRFDEDARLRVAIDEADTERLMWRLMATLAGAANPGEVLKLRGRLRGDRIKLTLQLPANLAAQDDDQLMGSVAGQASRALSAGMFGTGFSLRLAAAEARATGGELRRRDKTLQLRLPVLTGAEVGHSEMKLGGRSA